jgi:hypothetical protein
VKREIADSNALNVLLFIIQINFYTVDVQNQMEIGVLGDLIRCGFRSVIGWHSNEFMQ